VPERAEVRHARGGAPDTLQYMSGAPPDIQAGLAVRAPTVGTQWPGDVAGAPDTIRCAPDCPVHHVTDSLHQTTSLVVGAINTPTTPHSMASKFSTLPHLTRASIQYKTLPKRSNPLPTLHKALVIRESDLSCSFELLRLDRFFSFSFILVIKTQL
jgi:hypothetical protein